MLKIAFDPIYEHPLPEGHRFPMAKYALLPAQLRYEGLAEDDNFFQPTPATEEDILRVHKKSYWNRLKALELSRQEERRSGFPLSEGLVKREITIAGGSMMNAEFALKYGCSMNIAGGTHHAYSDRAEGFCLLNDIAISAAYMREKHGIKRILVVDLDVHQGNGTAEIFAQEKSVFTFSMHGANNYPLHKENSDLDIPLPDNTDDETYLQMLNDNFNKLMQKIDPELIYFQAGVDVLQTDKLGRLAMSMEGCRQRDQLVFDFARRNGVPTVVSMGGGYSERLADIVNAHANTFKEALSVL
jgi:acetoin utilization deacetylase AcuC-like enzyme